MLSTSVGDTSVILCDLTIDSRRTGWFVISLSHSCYQRQAAEQQNATAFTEAAWDEEEPGRQYEGFQFSGIAKSPKSSNDDDDENVDDDDDDDDDDGGDDEDDDDDGDDEDADEHIMMMLMMMMLLLLLMMHVDAC